MRRPPLTAILGILVAFLVASCAPGGGGGAPLSERVQLKVGVLGTTGDAPIYIAFERGYFDEQNIDVEFVRFGSALDMIAPLSSEQLDVGSGGIGAALFNAVSQGIPIKLVAETVRTPEDWTANAWFVRTAIADQVQTPADLRGLTVALASTCTVIDTELGVLLEQGGLTRDDVTIRTVPYADHAAAFANGSIDVTYGFEPFNSTFQQTGVARRWLTGGSVIPNHVQSGIIYGPSITSRPEVARAWMIAYLKGVREAYEHYEELPLPDEIVDILVKHGQQQDRERVATTRLSPRNLDGAIDENSVRTDLDFFSEAGCVENAPSLDEVIDNSYAESAVEQLGSAQ